MNEVSQHIPLTYPETNRTLATMPAPTALFDESVDSHNQGIVAGFTGYVCLGPVLAVSLTTLTGGAREDETVKNFLACEKLLALGKRQEVAKFPNPNYRYF
jgi:hypothetical protein